MTARAATTRAAFRAPTGAPVDLRPPRRATSPDLPGADLFKRVVWIAVSGLVLYVGNALLDRTYATSLFAAAVVGLVALLSAWSWAASSWRVWRSWRLVGSVPLAIAAVVLAGLHVADSLSGIQVETYQIGYAPQDVVALGDSWWVSDPALGLVYPFAEDGAVGSPIAIDGAFELAVAESEVWVSRQDPDGVTVLAVDGSVVGEAELPGPPADIVADARHVWFAFPTLGEVGRMDRLTRELTTWPVGSSPASLAVAADAVWVTDVDDASLRRLDPSDGRVVATFDVVAEPVGVWADDDAVWVANAASDIVTRVDPRSRTSRPLRVPARPTDLAVDGRTLWVVSQQAGTLTALDIDSGRVLDTLALDGGPLKVELVGSAVVVTNPTLGSVHWVRAELDAQS